MNRILALGTAVIFSFAIGGIAYFAFYAQADREEVRDQQQESTLMLAVNEQKVPEVAKLPLADKMQNEKVAAKLPSSVTRQNAQTAGQLPMDDSNHPRLFFDTADIPALRRQISTTHSEIWTYIDRYATSLVGESPPTSVPVEQNLETFRVAGNQVIVPAFSCVITQDPNLCEGAKQYLLTYSAWANWDEQNHRDLGLAHMLMGNAIAYDWLYQFLSSDERQFVRDNLAGWAEKMYEASASPTFVDEWQNWWRIAYLQNHYSTNNSALGVVGLVLLGEDVRAEQWVAHAQSKMADLQLLLNGIDDGTWHEGIPYQNYQLSMMLPFLVNLERIQGIDLLPHDYLRKFAYWRLYNLLPGSPEFALQTGNFDAYWSNDYPPQSLLRFVAREYGDGFAEWTAQQILANLGRSADQQTMPWYIFELLYYDPSVSAHAPSGLNLSRLFPDHGAVIWRTGWSQNDLVFSLKNGPHGGRSAYHAFLEQQQPWDCDGSGCEYSLGHEHDDNNTFSIWQSGQWLAAETIGYDRFETSLHNTILVDGQGQQRIPGGHEPSELLGRDNYFEANASTSGFDYLASNATGSYQNIEGIEDITRYVLFVRPGYFLILDHMEADRVHDYDWVVHLGGEPDIADNWIRSSAEGGQVLGVGIVSPQPFATSSGNDEQPYIRIRPTSSVADTNFINLLYPTDENGWDARPIVALEEDNGKAALVRVQFDGEQGVDDIMLRYDKASAMLELGPYAFDGHVAVVSRVLRMAKCKGSLSTVERFWLVTQMEQLWPKTFREIWHLRPIMKDPLCS